MVLVVLLVDCPSSVGNFVDCSRLDHHAALVDFEDQLCNLVLAQAQHPDENFEPVPEVEASTDPDHMSAFGMLNMIVGTVTSLVSRCFQ